MKVFSIKDIPEFSNKERIVVVGIIGKSPYRYPNKTAPLLHSVQYDENDIECHWDERRGILFLHAVTYLDTKRLAQLAENLSESSPSTIKDADASHWLVASGELAIESCKAIALIFHLCQIVVLSTPTAVFDLNYLQLFKAVDAYRSEVSTQATYALLNAGLGSGSGGVWEAHGRPCCPRLLFHFRRAPAPLRKAPASLKKLEHSVEDQLYFILRKSRIITNVCAKSLFAIPKNEEFVYISAEEHSGHARDVSSLLRGLVRLCTGPPAASAAPAAPADSERPTFAQFLQAHVDLAFGEGFDDNVGKYAMSISYFELSSAAAWRAAAKALVPVYLQDTPAPAEDSQEGFGALFDVLATDVRFSQARCAKVLPIAQASYTEGLPSHYSSDHHAHKVAVALGVLEAMARGPLAGGARARLRGACAAAWRPRRLCAARSLSGHPCVHPEHDSSKEHSSGVVYVCACNCGRTRASRDDPYTVRQANFTFYEQAAEQCSYCLTLHSIQFPVFQPSTPSFRAASVKGATEEGTAGVEVADGDAGEGVSVRGGDGVSDESGGAGWSAEELSPGSARDDDEDDAPPASAHSAHSTHSALDVLPSDEHANDTEEGSKMISRQPSTTEYLPGMLHERSPAALLPPFPSWSLVCLGPSSLYSHSAGLPEALQPGFLNHTNYLLPWDCTVRLEQAGAWRGGGARGRGKGGLPHHVTTVKIFIGFEYECPRGHRFMMWGPETVAAGGGGAGGAALGARLAASAMPLYAACPARHAGHAHAHSHALAHAARVHVVTPKAPVHVTLDPKVQPMAGGPVFVPQPVGSPPLKLTASAYWVLRLPYVYSDERGALPRPRDAPARDPGALLTPMFGLHD